MQHTLCVYQPIVPGRDLAAVSGNAGEVHIGRRDTVTFDEQARPTITVAPSVNGGPRYAVSSAFRRPEGQLAV